MPGSSRPWRGANVKAMAAATVLAITGLGMLGAEVLAQPAAPDAKAQPSSPPDYEAAKRHYNNAQTAASEGRWQDAAREYGIALEITKDPVLFFKLANAYDQDGDCATALGYYRRYLAEAKPDEAFAQLTKDKIGACEAKVNTAPATQPSTDTDPPTTAPTDPPTDPTTDPTRQPATSETDGTDGSKGSETATGATSAPVDSEDPPMVADNPLTNPSDVDQPTWQRTAAWISVGVAVSFGVTGTVLGLAARSRQDDIDSDIGFRDLNNLPARFQGTAANRYEDLVNQGEKLEVAAFITFGAAVAAVAAATVFFVIDPGPEGDSNNGFTIAPAVGPDSAGVAAGWRF